MKKIFIISAILLGVLLLFLGIYNFAFRKNTPAVEQKIVEPIMESTKKIPVIKAEKITGISDGAVLGPVMDKKTEEIKYYDALTGIVWKMNSDGSGKKQITDTKVSALKSVLWSPDHSKVLTIKLKDGQSTFYMYDYKLQKGTQLKDGFTWAVWDNLGTKILYRYFDAASSEGTLNIANPDGSGWQKIADIEAKKLNIAPIPLSALVSYWNYPNAAEETKLQVVGTVGGESKTILSGKYGADYLWSPKGDVAIVSSLSNKEAKTVMLGLITLDGKYQDLNIPTLASKCTWSQDGKTVYYALPGEIPAGAIMPNEYQENKFNTDDTFWKMDITTGIKSRIIETSEIAGKYDSSNLFLSTTEDALYFVNRLDQKLYRIQL